MSQPAPLPHVGTRVRVTVGGYTAYGVVEDYEHYHPSQTTFPVKFGRKTTMMTAADVTVEADQPDDRTPPRCTMLAQFLPCTMADHRVCL
jgi:hypothetical protein